MKALITILLNLILIINVNAQNDSYKVLLEKISGKYSGSCQNGLANGKVNSIGEDTYIGTFKDGLPNGRGKYIHKNGDIFQGYWQNGQKDGKGIFDYSLNGQELKLVGYWKNDEYVGVSEPDVSFRVTSNLGITNYKVEEMEQVNEHDNGITLSIKSVFTVGQYFCPLHCEISYSILVGEVRKQCRFIIDFLKEGKYIIVLHND